MASTLLMKEKEYYKMNEELELRSKELFQEAIVYKKSHEFINDSPIETKYEAFKVNFNSNSKNEPSLPEHTEKGLTDMGVKGLLHFFKAKVKTLQADCDKLQAELKTKCDEVRKLQQDHQKVSEEKDKWHQNVNANKIYISKLENQLSTMKSKLQIRENENVGIKKEVDKLSKELKAVNNNTANCELKLSRLLEENEKMKTILKNQKQEEKELKETHFKEVTEMTGLLKHVEKQKIELVNAFKKQLQLVDNLKKQKAQLEIIKLAQIANGEFIKLLEWRIKD